MIVSYSIKRGDELVGCESYADAAGQAAEDEEIWILADSKELLALPDHFDRVLIADDQDFRTLVLKRRELSGNYPSGALAPQLIIDMDLGRVVWLDENQVVRVLYRERQG